MRGLLFLFLFTASLPLIFISAFNGVLIWYIFSLGNFHALVWGPLSDLYYAYIIAILTCLSWVFSTTDRKALPFTPLLILTLIFSLWMTITSIYTLAPEADVWDKWMFVHKMLFMALVGYALTTTQQRVNQLVWVIVPSIGFWGVRGGIVGILQGGANIIYGPPEGAISDNNDFGLALLITLPFIILYQWQQTDGSLSLGQAPLPPAASQPSRSTGRQLHICSMDAWSVKPPGLGTKESPNVLACASRTSSYACT